MKTTCTFPCAAVSSTVLSFANSGSRPTKTVFVMNHFRIGTWITLKADPKNIMNITIFILFYHPPSRLANRYLVSSQGFPNVGIWDGFGRLQQPGRLKTNKNNLSPLQRASLMSPGVHLRAEIGIG